MVKEIIKQLNTRVKKFDQYITFAEHFGKIMDYYKEWMNKNRLI